MLTPNGHLMRIKVFEINRLMTNIIHWNHRRKMLKEQ